MRCAGEQVVYSLRPPGYSPIQHDAPSKARSACEGVSFVAGGISLRNDEAEISGTLSCGVTLPMVEPRALWWVRSRGGGGRQTYQCRVDFGKMTYAPFR